MPPFPRSVLPSVALSARTFFTACHRMIIMISDRPGSLPWAETSDMGEHRKSKKPVP
jgi:hypothetical protein